MALENAVTGLAAFQACQGTLLLLRRNWEYWSLVLVDTKAKAIALGDGVVAGGRVAGRWGQGIFLKIHGIEIQHERNVFLSLLGDVWSSRPAPQNSPRAEIDHKWKNRMKAQERLPLPYTHIPAWHPTRRLLLSHV